MAFYYNILNRLESILSLTLGHKCPHVNENGLVVWHNDNGVYLKNGSGTFHISSIGRDPTILDNGYIIWKQNPRPAVPTYPIFTWEICIHNGQTVSLIGETNENGQIFGNRYGHVVWSEYSANKNIFNIYLYDGSSKTLIASGRNSHYPKVNDTDHVLWCDNNHTDPYVVYLAKPKTSTDPVEAFVTRFYNLCLGRVPDPGGLAGWTNGLKTQAVYGGDVAYGFIFSTEFVTQNKSNEDFVTILYRAFFDREPDAPGFAGWLNNLNSGWDRSRVLDGFVYSVEFRSLCDAYGIKATQDNSLLAKNGHPIHMAGGQYSDGMGPHRLF